MALTWFFDAEGGAAVVVFMPLRPVVPPPPQAETASAIIATGTRALADEVLFTVPPSAIGMLTRSTASRRGYLTGRSPVSHSGTRPDGLGFLSGRAVPVARRCTVAVPH